MSDYMITDEYLQRMYVLKKNKDILTRNDFLECGFKNHDIKSLIEKGFIVRIKHGQYMMVKDSVLLDNEFKKCIDLVLNNEYEEAKKIFRNCYKVDSKYIEELFKLILQSISSRFYNKVFKYFELALTIDDERYIKDIKFYLYLFDHYTYIPDKYRELLSNLQYEDIMIDKEDKRYKNSFFYNMIRKQALINKYFYCSKRNDWQMRTIYERINTILINRIKKKQSYHYMLMNEWYKGKDYQRIVLFLNEKKEKLGLRKDEESILLLSQYVIDIKDRKEFPIISNDLTDNVFKAIKIGNFNLASELANEFEKKKNKTSLITLLLRDIIKLINDKEYNSSNVTFNDIALMLIIRQDIKIGINKIVDYLRDINKSEYEVLVSNLVRISNKEGDNTFVRPLMILNQIKKDDFNFNIDYYKNCFYQAIEENEVEIANWYLDIILNSKKMGCNVTTENLLQDLRHVQKLMVEDSTSKIENCLNEQEKNTFVAKTWYSDEEIKEIIDKIEISGLDVESACRKLNISKEMINFIRLIYAKEYYRQGFYAEGDKFVKVVESSKGKSKKIKKELDDIRKTRNFYKYHDNSDSIGISRILKPKK